MGKVFFQSGRDVTPGQIVSSGLPRERKILKSSSISESPGHKARLVIISAIIVPEDQMSTHGA